MSESTHIKEGGQLPLDRTLSRILIMIMLSTQFVCEKENESSMSWSELLICQLYCVSWSVQRAMFWIAVSIKINFSIAWYDYVVSTAPNRTRSAYGSNWVQCVVLYVKYYFWSRWTGNQWYSHREFVRAEYVHYHSHVERFFSRVKLKWLVHTYSTYPCNLNLIRAKESLVLRFWWWLMMIDFHWFSFMPRYSSSIYELYGKQLFALVRIW